MPDNRRPPEEPGRAGREMSGRSDFGFVRGADEAPRAPQSDEHRSFVSRARDEVQAWLGDASAEERLHQDARLAGKPREEADYRDEDDIVWSEDSGVGVASHESGEPLSSESSGYRPPDPRIAEEVADRLTDDPDLDASNIRVDVTGGEVRLSGHVDSDEARKRAQQLAEGVSGVGRLWNQLEVDGL